MARSQHPLAEDIIAVGKTPTGLAHDIEQVLATYIKNPVVIVIVTDFVGAFSEQIRVVGQAANPKALPYRERMTLLDVMIEVGGLTEFAAGNRAKIVRRNGNEEQEIRVRLETLIADGDVSANVRMVPGDILIIPDHGFSGKYSRQDHCQTKFDPRLAESSDRFHCRIFKDYSVLEALRNALTHVEGMWRFR
jgi:polysaccharide biosynthesis/export protein